MDVPPGLLAGIRFLIAGLMGVGAVFVIDPKRVGSGFVTEVNETLDALETRRRSGSREVAAYFSEGVRRQLQETYGNADLYRGGMVVRTTLDRRLQQIANEAQVNAIGYTFLFQRNDVEKAIEIVERNVAAHPESWNVYDSLGEAYASKGETALAIKAYSKAHEMAPEAQKARIESVLAGLRE